MERRAAAHRQIDRQTDRQAYRQPDSDAAADADADADAYMDTCKICLRTQRAAACKYRDTLTLLVPAGGVKHSIAPPVHYNDG